MGKMKSQTAKARNILYTHFNDGLVHDKDEYRNQTMRQLSTTQEWADKFLKIFTKTQEIHWLGNAQFVVTGSPTQMRLGDV